MHDDHHHQNGTTPAVLRGEGGKFLKGTAPGPGNPSLRRVNELRAGLLSAVSPEDVADVVRKLTAMAKEGDLDAAALLLDRTLGKAPQAIAVQADVSLDAHIDHRAIVEVAAEIRRDRGYVEYLRRQALDEDAGHPVPK